MEEWNRRNIENVKSKDRTPRDDMKVNEMQVIFKPCKKCEYRFCKAENMKANR